MINAMIGYTYYAMEAKKKKQQTFEKIQRGLHRGGGDI